MPLITRPIQARDGFSQVAKPDDELQHDLRILAIKHHLSGCVLVQFTFDDMRVGTRCWGFNDTVCSAMTTLAERILTDIDDGRHDPLEHIEAEGGA